MNWQRAARWIVAGIGVGCAVAIFFYTRNRPAPPAPPASLTKIDPTSALEGGAGKTIRLREGRSPITLTFEATRQYDDGRSRFETVLIEGLEGSRFAVRAGLLEIAGQAAGTERPSRFNLSNSVVLTTDDGFELKSETGIWDDATNQLTMPGPVTFKKGRLSGTSVGAVYDHQLDAFTLLDQATAHVEPDASGGSSADATATRMILVRGQKTLQLEENATIVGDIQTLTSKTATLAFTEDEHAIKYLELRGSARATPKPGGPPDRPEMSADNITMSFYEDGMTLQHAALTGQAVLNLSGEGARSVRASWIDLFTAKDGRTLTRLQAKDRVVVTLAPTSTTPGRTITSTVLSASGDEKQGLTSARFEGNPRFEETPASGGRGAGAPQAGDSRAGTATTLVLKLGGRIDAIERAEFQQHAKFQSGDMTGEADVAQYEEASGLLHLLPNAREPRRLSRVTTPDMSVDGATIDVDTNSDDLKAQGSVTTRVTRAPGSGGDSRGALFGGDEPIIGGADTLRFVNSTGTAFYTGTGRAQAQLIQGQSKVVADRIEFTNTTQNLAASGNVDSIWLLEQTPSATGEAALKRYRVRAETLQYDETARTAVYKGPLVSMTTDDGNVEARVLTFRLLAESRALETMLAERNVWAKLSGGYEAIGDVLLYRADTELYTLEGKAGSETAQVKSPRSDDPPSTTPKCNLNDGMKLELDKRTGVVRIPGEGQAPRNVSEILCSVSLRRSK